MTARRRSLIDTSVYTYKIHALLHTTLLNATNPPSLNQHLLLFLAGITDFQRDQG